MKKIIASLFLALLLLLPAMPVRAAAADSVTFYACSKVRDGEYYSCDEEYLVLNFDGTGMVVYRGNAYELNWADVGNGDIRFSDSKGNEFTGAMDDDLILTGSFHGYSYTYQPGADAPVKALSPETWGRGLPPVTDEADLLLDVEERELTAKAEELSEKYGCNVYIITVQDLCDYSVTSSVETCNEEIRCGYSLGYGGEKNCVVLLLSMADREYDLMAYGPFGNAAFTDYGKSYVADRFLDDFRDNDWVSGFSDYLKTCGLLLDRAAKGDPVDVNSRPVNKLVSVAASLVIGFIAALIVCKLLSLGMKPTKEKTTAEEYVPVGGVNILHRMDRYTHTTETRVYDPPNRSSGGSSGGGTSIGSSGHSHSSGHF